MTRRLVLRRETLTELGDDLLGVVGGGTTTGPRPTPPVYAPRTIELEECFAVSVYLNCGDITASPRCV